MDSIGKTLAALVLTVVAVAGMLMTACGGLFTIILLPDSGGPGQGASYAKGRPHMGHTLADWRNFHGVDFVPFALQRVGRKIGAARPTLTTRERLAE
jgi:hypothetical protein